MQAQKKLQREFRRLSGLVDAGAVPCVSDLSMDEADLSVWRFRLHSFDEDTEAGRELNADLLRVTAQWGHPPAILMEARCVGWAGLVGSVLACSRRAYVCAWIPGDAGNEKGSRQRDGA